MVRSHSRQAFYHCAIPPPFSGQVYEILKNIPVVVVFVVVGFVPAVVAVSSFEEAVDSETRRKSNILLKESP